MAISKIERRYTRTYDGSFAVVRKCVICGHIEIVKKGITNAGRGYGFREGNKARGRIIQHVKEKHLKKGVIFLSWVNFGMPVRAATGKPETGGILKRA